MRVLVVDDEPSLRLTLSRILAAEGHEVVTAADGEEALAKLEEVDADLVLCDLRMPRLDGLQFLGAYQERAGRAPVIAMSAYGDAQTAIAALQHGAHDFLQKPFRAEELLLSLRKAVERQRRQERATVAEAAAAIAGPEASIIGVSHALREAVELARKVAPYPLTVLLTGESGTGKELIARLIHATSRRAGAAFVAVNCGAIPETLVESELFGHVKGAFTGATIDKPGLFEEADGGTLFLDEVGELPAPLQVKLLRVLQEGDVRRVGATVSRTVDVRIIAATNRDLATDVTTGRFRSDLYYRVNVVGIRLPPLRERREDIPILVDHFLQSHARRLGIDPRPLAARALELLNEYSWPGNVRELANVIERALVLATGDTIEAAALPEVLRAAPGAPLPSDSDLSIKRGIEQLERTLIGRALERTQGNRTRAARLLELSHRALLYKIREYGLGD
ncbi:MAG TPA: sigma-54 dependent transcriptional regulator [Gemmatimonadaceae bacterium]|nr:sigma-54 dependent transcriptional regulator [Gemmatimonadaceae bacterium]